MTHPLKGRKQSPEHVAKRVAAIRATGAYERNGARLAALSKANAGKTVRSQAQIEKHRAKMMGRSREWLVGRKVPIEVRRKKAAYWAANREKHNHYIDGKGFERTSERLMEMSRLEYRLWREGVFKRDDWTCVQCSARGGRLHADHIKAWATHPELRYDLSNGRTLCVKCHRKTPTYGSQCMALKKVIANIAVTEAC